MESLTYPLPALIIKMRSFEIVELYMKVQQIIAKL